MNTPNLMSLAADAAELNELDNLLEKGLSVEIKKQSLLRYVGKPTRTFRFMQPFLGTLDHLSRLWLLMQFDPEAFQADSANEAKRLTGQHAHRVAQVVAIAWANSFWGIRLAAPLMAYYFRWHLNPQTLLRLTMLIFQLSNLSDFISSIGLMSAAKRTTMPTPMENSPANLQGGKPLA